MSRPMYDPVDNLIHKIYRFLSANDKRNVRQMVTNARSDADVKLSMDKIAYIVTRHVKQAHLKPDDNRQDFIVSKITAFLRAHAPSIMNAYLAAADIGGGNGNVLSGINNDVHGDRERFTCVENISNWSETYDFNHTNISYTFWDNQSIHIADHSCDVVFCMVSLHHMTDEVVAVALAEIRRILKPAGLLMIKEHDANSPSAKQLIDWEHHLYHILDCAYSGQTLNYEMYKRTTNNFKSKETWKKMIETYSFKFGVRTNRFLDGPYIADDAKNATNLYWDVYTKV